MNNTGVRRGILGMGIWLPHPLLAVVFVLVSAIFTTHAVQAQTLTVIYTFTGGADGGAPYGGLVRDATGNLYGTTFLGGTSHSGTVFKIDTAGQESVLYSFTGGADGGSPYFGSLLLDAGNLYGTTLGGGAFGVGTVFKVSIKTSKEVVLYSFNNKNGDGEGPISGVISDKAGNLYGTTETGGDYNCNAPLGCGVVFKLTPTGEETLLHVFMGGTDGEMPYGGLVMDSTGNLYGTTHMGGSDGNGVIFKVSGSDKEKVLYTFLGGTDAANPGAGLARDAKGNLYGTSYFGGTYSDGTVFMLSNTGHETVLYNFAGYPKDGAFPDAPLILDSTGNLYGTTVTGGTNGDGTVFELDSTGQETARYDLNYKDGALPYGALVRDKAGNLYGTAAQGGIGNCGGATCGTVFLVTP